MNLRSLPYFLLVSILLLVTSCSESPVFKRYETVFKVGDQQEWAAKDLNDQYWDKGKPIVFGGSDLLVPDSN